MSKFLLRILCNQIHEKRDPGYIVIIHIKYFAGPFHALDDLCDDLWPQTLLISETWARPGHKQNIQMISDPVFVTIKSSLLRLGSGTIEWVYFLNYCFAIVTDTECCDGCHLHLAQRQAAVCVCLLSSVLMAGDLIHLWGLSSLSVRPNFAYTGAQAAGARAFSCLITWDL